MTEPLKRKSADALKSASAPGGVLQLIEEHVGHFEAMEDSYLRSGRADSAVNSECWLTCRRENLPASAFPQEYDHRW